jgi:hypothetical protein
MDALGEFIKPFFYCFCRDFFLGTGAQYLRTFILPNLINFKKLSLKGQGHDIRMTRKYIVWFYRSRFADIFQIFRSEGRKGVIFKRE